MIVIGRVSQDSWKGRGVKGGAGYWVRKAVGTEGMRAGNWGERGCLCYRREGLAGNRTRGGGLVTKGL